MLYIGYLITVNGQNIKKIVFGKRQPVRLTVSQPVSPAGK